jgi:hypothetical protein
VLHIYWFCLEHLLDNQVQYIAYRLRVLHIYWFCLEHLLGNQVQYIVFVALL